MTAMKDRATASLCPVCLERIPAERVVRGENVFLKKRCPEHGDFEALIWKGTPDMARWHRPKIPAYPKVVGHETMRPLLARMPMCQADSYRAMYETP